jgi:hypothetical protein
MQTVDEKPETIHLYVVREEEPKPSLLPIFLSTILLFLLLLLCVFSSYQQPDIRKTIRVPAVFLPVQLFTTTAAIIPTGSKTYPATTSQGILTITNGSVIASELPQGLIFTSSNGTEISTDASTFVPAGSAAGFGYATVSAHALISGKQGNIPAYAINRVEGTSIYIRNLQPFTGGRDAYSVNIVTKQDKQTALQKARTILSPAFHPAIPLVVLSCHAVEHEVVKSITVNVACQYVTYSLPAYMTVTSVRVVGKNLFLDVFYRPRFTRVGQK